MHRLGILPDGVYPAQGPRSFTCTQTPSGAAGSRDGGNLPAVNREALCLILVVGQGWRERIPRRGLAQGQGSWSWRCQRVRWLRFADWGLWVRF